MGRHEHLSLVALTLVAGLVGGTVLNWSFMPSTATAQDTQRHEEGNGNPVIEFLSEIAPLWSMIQSLAIIGSLIFIFQQVRLHRNANMIQLLSNIRKEWNARRMMDCRRAACKNYQAETRTKKIGMPESEVLGFFEQMGLLLRKRVVSSEFVWETYSYYIEHYWSMLESNIAEFRRSTKDDSWYECFEYLRNSMRNYSKKKGCPSTDKAEEEVEQFIRGELEGLRVDNVVL